MGIACDLGPLSTTPFRRGSDLDLDLFDVRDVERCGSEWVCFG